jgi:DNA-directed RNA polymerase subunit M
MEFCDECGSMMRTDGDAWVCGNCGYEKARDSEADERAVTTQKQEDGGVIDTSEVGAEDMGPTTNADCPNCDNDRAFWEMKQIRSADESETRFFTCTECGKKWREDDH